ncbi:hypothetical protein [Falsarthrobacter nasiphocae]|uniref:Histone acetyltransferase n=1 Tax=Falsarthrobacter nasiphocae TaxID=189863 RepID=A0AAE4C813_9MICC|nr:hypothetical protein [Falsarthrobacter nasiphocae]MDR6891940.1 hypothetical protein [Falsarthrobacter nasiphocae]
MTPREHHKPVVLPPAHFSAQIGGADPAQLEEAAHATARIVLARGRANTDPELTARLVSITDTEGIEAIAGLWAGAGPDTLPGALWRLYALRDAIRRQPTRMALLFREGADSHRLSTVLAGVAQPPGAEEVKAMADEILEGVFTGEFDIALRRAAAFARTVALGQALDADRADRASERAGAALTTGSARLIRTAEELEEAADLWRAGELH